MPRRPIRRQTHKLPDRSPRYPSNITTTTTVEVQTAEASFDQLYEDALSDAFALRLNELFDSSFDKAFEDHFNGVYNKIIRNKFDAIYDKINEKNARMRSGDQGCSSTTAEIGEGGSTGTSPTPLQPLKKDYQPRDILRRKIRRGISHDIRKEILFRVREAVRKDLEPEMRKSVSREAFWDILQEAKSQNDQRKDEMGRTSLPPKLPQPTNSTDDQRNPTSGITKLPAAKGEQSKSKNDRTTAMARTILPGKGQPQAKDDQNVSSGNNKAKVWATEPHSKFLEDLD